VAKVLQTRNLIAITRMKRRTIVEEIEQRSYRFSKYPIPHRAAAMMSPGEMAQSTSTSDAFKACMTLIQWILEGGNGEVSDEAKSNGQAVPSGIPSIPQAVVLGCP